MKAVDLIRDEGYDYLLAVGGGSVVDGTKFIAAAAEFAGDPWDILEIQARVEKALPLSCILTLPATGSESNTGAVVTRGQDKLFFGTELVRPVFAVLDPAVTFSLPPRQVAKWCRRCVRSHHGAIHDVPGQRQSAGPVCRRFVDDVDRRRAEGVVRTGRFGCSCQHHVGGNHGTEWLDRHGCPARLVHAHDRS